MEDEAKPSKSNTCSAELPEDFGKSDSPPKTTRREEPAGREDRAAIPPDGCLEKGSELRFERFEDTIHEHLRNEIEFSRAAREIVEDQPELG